MTKIVDVRKVRPADLVPGDVMVVTVTLHVGYHGDYFRMYRCPYPNAEVSSAGIPQGEQILQGAQPIAEALFPVATWAGLKPE